MPGFDGTGPQGTGPFGKGLGPCNEDARPYRRSFFGYGRGGRGRGRRYPQWNLPFGDEKSALNSEKSWLTQELEAIKKRLSDLEKEKE